MTSDPSNYYISKLNEIQSSNLETLYLQSSDEPRLIINTNARSITVPSVFSYAGVINDHNAETIFFEVDRYFDNVDLNDHTCVIQYINGSGEQDVYPVTMKNLDTEGKIIFAWTISNNVTKVKGTINFAVRFYTLETVGEDNDGNPLYAFSYNLNTTPASFRILDGLNCDATEVVNHADSFLVMFNQLNDKINEVATINTNVNDTASTVDGLVSAATSAATNANTKAGLANTAATNANTAAQNANDKATLANDAAQNAKDTATNLETTYAPRLTGVESGLSQKANSSEVRKIINPIEMGDLASSVKTAMTGGSVAVVGGESTSFGGWTNALKSYFGTYNTISMQVIETTSSATDVSTLNDGYWRKGRFNSSGVYGSNDYAYYTKLSAEAGDRFKITASFYGNTWYCASAYNVSNVLIQNFLAGDASSYHRYTDEIIVAPANTAYIVIQTGESTYRTIKKMLPINVVNTDNNVNSMGSKLKMLKSVDTTFTNGSAYLSNGTTISNANSKIALQSCLSGEVYSVSGKTLGSGYYFIQTYNSSNAVVRRIGNDSSNYNSSIQIDNFEFTVGATETSFSITANINSSCTVRRKDDSSLSELQTTIENTVNNISSSSTTKNDPSLCIGSKLYAVVGDTLQIYYKSIVDSFDKYFLAISCSKGKNYPRYWEYTPVSGDVGSTTMTLTLYNKDSSIIESKTVTLITASATNPSTSKNILHIGDSLIMDGQIPIELSRRLKGTSGVATSPTALNLSNFNVVGRKKNASNTVGWEGTGGWTFSTYMTANGIQGVRWQVSGVTNANIGDIYQANYSGGYYRFQVMEINVTGGTGNIMMGFYTTPYDANFNTRIVTNSTISKVSGTGQASISYSTYAVENYQPFWNTSTNAFDITSYVNTYCSNKVDYIYLQLGINSYIGNAPFDALNSVLADCKSLINLIHTQLPNCIILLATNCLPSQNGGLAASYNASSNGNIYGEYGFNHKVFVMNKLFMTLESDTNYNSFVKVLNIHAQVDSDNVYPTSPKPLNTRITTTEESGTNSVHFKDEGYWQDSDGLFRALIVLNQ